MTTVVAAPPLVDWGATQASWDANHHRDPEVTAGDGFWPRLANGLDSYASVRFVGGRAMRYTLNLLPAESLAGAEARVADELPPDATLASSIAVPAGQPTCEQMIFRSAVLRADLGDEVVAVARSSDGQLDRGSITTIGLAPSTARSQPAPGC